MRKLELRPRYCTLGSKWGEMNSVGHPEFHAITLRDVRLLRRLVGGSILKSFAREGQFYEMNKCLSLVHLTSKNWISIKWFG
jgi:hypothetical protein